MDTKEAVVQNKARIRMNELKIEALIHLLSQEGIITKEEVEQKLNEMIGKQETN